MSRKMTERDFNEMVLTKPYRFIKEVYADVALISELLNNAQREEDPIIKIKMFESTIVLVNRATSTMRGMVKAVREDENETDIGQVEIVEVGETIGEFEEKVNQQIGILKSKVEEQLEQTTRAFNDRVSKLGTDAVQTELPQETRDDSGGLHTEEADNEEDQAVSSVEDETYEPKPTAEIKCAVDGNARYRFERKQHKEGSKSKGLSAEDVIRRSQEEKQEATSRGGLMRRLWQALGVVEKPMTEEEYEANRARMREMAAGERAQRRLAEKQAAEGSQEVQEQTVEKEENTNVVQLFPQGKNAAI